MNAFPKATEALLSAYRNAHTELTAAEFEPGAAPLKQAVLRELDVKIRQYEQQSGELTTSTSLVVEPLIRRSANTTMQATPALVPLPLADPLIDYATLDINNLTYEEMETMWHQTGGLSFPEDVDQRREMLQKAQSEGIMSPEVVTQRLNRNQLLQALETETIDAILDSYGEETIRNAGKYLLGEPTITDKEPAKVANKKFIIALKDAQVKKKALDTAKAGASVGGGE